MIRKIGLILAVLVLGLSTGSAATTQVSHEGNSTQDSGNLVREFVDGFVVKEKFEIETDGDISSGEQLSLTVYSDENPVSDATVAVNGKRIGDTGKEGVIEVEVPDSSIFRVKAHKGDYVGYLRSKTS